MKITNTQTTNMERRPFAAEPDLAIRDFRESGTNGFSLPTAIHRTGWGVQRGIFSIMALLALLSLLVGLTGCLVNNEENYYTTPGENGGGDKEIITDPVEGTMDRTDITEREDGSLVIKTPGDSLVLANADLHIEYNEDGTVKSMEGKASIPSPTNYIEIVDPVEAGVGYFTGAHLNELWEVPIPLVANRYYMAFKLAVNTEIKVGANNNTEDTKPISLKPPVGGHIIEIIDMEDPFFYFSASQDLMGELCFGGSTNPIIPFEPLQPHEKFDSFKGRSFRCGTFPLFKGVSVTGSIIQDIGFTTELTAENPLPLSFDAHYYAGINGEFNLGLPIKGWVEFGFPLGEASAAVTAEAGTNGVRMQMFMNGLAKPDNSWWPEFIPVRPAAQMRVKGYVDQSGDFDLGISGDMGLELPTGYNAIDGLMQLTPEAFTLEGAVIADDLRYSVGARFESELTDFYTEFPEEDGLVNNMTTLLEEQIKGTATRSVDSSIAEVMAAKEKHLKAVEDYEFERSLRGLRKTLPTLSDETISFINSKSSSIISSARKSADNAISSPGKRCSDNITSVVNGITKPYIDALKDLKNAALKEDDETARTQLEAALRKLASMQTINKSVKAKVKVGNKITGCGITSSHYRTVKVNITVLSDENVSDLLTAADNMKNIPATSEEVIRAQAIIDELPSEEDLRSLREDILNEVDVDLRVSRVGFVKTKNDPAFHYYIVINDERHEAGSVDIFDLASIAEVATEFLESGNE